MASGTLTAARPAAAGYESTAPAASLAHLVELLCSVDQRQVSSFLCRQIVLLVFTVRVRERCYARPKADAARRRVQEFLPVIYYSLVPLPYTAINVADSCSLLHAGRSLLLVLTITINLSASGTAV